jgi:hypothetical protein
MMGAMTVLVLYIAGHLRTLSIVQHQATMLYKSCVTKTATMDDSLFKQIILLKEKKRKNVQTGPATQDISRVFDRQISI